MHDRLKWQFMFLRFFKKGIGWWNWNRRRSNAIGNWRHLDLFSFTSFYSAHLWNVLFFFELNGYLFVGKLVENGSEILLQEFSFIWNFAFPAKKNIEILKVNQLILLLKITENISDNIGKGSVILKCVFVIDNKFDYYRILIFRVDHNYFQGILRLESFWNEGLTWYFFTLIVFGKNHQFIYLHVVP